MRGKIYKLYATEILINLEYIVIDGEKRKKKND